jgi:hypothetical protein
VRSTGETLPSSEPFARLLSAALIWPGAVGAVIGLHWVLIALRPMPHDTGMKLFEMIAIVIVILLEMAAVPLAIFKLLRQREFRNWRNIAVTLVGVVGALPGALLLLGMWALGGDWT